MDTDRPSTRSGSFSLGQKRTKFKSPSRGRFEQLKSPIGRASRTGSKPLSVSFEQGGAPPGRTFNEHGEEEARRPIAPAAAKKVPTPRVPRATKPDKLPNLAGPPIQKDNKFEYPGGGYSRFNPLRMFLKPEASAVAMNKLVSAWVATKGSATHAENTETSYKTRVKKLVQFGIATNKPFSSTLTSVNAAPCTITSYIDTNAVIYTTMQRMNLVAPDIFGDGARAKAWVDTRMAAQSVSARATIDSTHFKRTRIDDEDNGGGGKRRRTDPHPPNSVPVDDEDGTIVDDDLADIDKEIPPQRIGFERLQPIAKFYGLDGMEKLAFAYCAIQAFGPPLRNQDFNNLKVNKNVGGPDPALGNHMWLDQNRRVNIYLQFHKTNGHIGPHTYGFV
ncbi:hypothetical protein T492DRAFT_877096 [Pavlovales sp. CCMP2436]|nr:hypothetical protein T492DRAFT_877096 [Pavlovales sp. CCMP2436]